MNGSTFVFSELARIVAKLSLLSIFVVFSIYTVAYVVLLVRYRLPAWTTVAAFLEGRGQAWFRLLTFCQVCALLTPLAFVAFAASLDASATERYEALTRIALTASVAFAVLSSVYYFVQLVLAKADLSDARGASLEHLFQLNPRAMFTAVNILGWTLFFAIACLCLGPLFRGSPGARVFGAFLVANGIVCLVGMAGYLWRIRILNVLFFNGMGLTVLGFSLIGFAIL